MYQVSSRRLRTIATVYVAACILLLVAGNCASLIARTKSERDAWFIWLYFGCAMTIMVCSASYPRIWVVISGAFACSCSFIIGITISFGVPIVGGYGVPFAIAIAWPSLVALAVITWVVSLPFVRICTESSELLARACSQCGYSLRGVPGNRCPECGRSQP